MTTLGSVLRALPGSTTSVRHRLTVAGACFLVAFALLLVDVFVPVAWLQVLALAFTGTAFVALWTAVVRWRMPVLSNRVIWALTLIWCAALGVAIVLVLLPPAGQVGLARRAAAQWLAFSISLSLGSLQFRALFHRRATSILARILSFLSPMIVLCLILLQALRG
jgi:hypothetical protein